MCSARFTVLPWPALTLIKMVVLIENSIYGHVINIAVNPDVITISIVLRRSSVCSPLYLSYRPGNLYEELQDN